MNILQKAAEILVECGYAEGTFMWHNRYLWQRHDKNKELPYIKNTLTRVDPFADTLEGFRQLFALVDYFQFKSGDDGALWVKGWLKMKPDMNMYDRLIITVNWCLEQLIKEAE